VTAPLVPVDGRHPQPRTIGLAVRALEELIEDTEFMKDFERRGMDRVPTEIPKEVAVLLEDNDPHASPREEPAQHQTGRTATRDRALDVHARSLPDERSRQTRVQFRLPQLSRAASRISSTCSSNDGFLTNLLRGLAKNSLTCHSHAIRLPLPSARWRQRMPYRALER